MIDRFSRVIALFLALAAGAPRPARAGAAERPESIEELIQGLGDSSWEVREESQRALLSRGKEAADSLARAVNSRDPEIALRAKLILSQVNPVVVRVRIQRIELEDRPQISETLEGEVGEGGEIQLPPRPQPGERGGYSVRLRVVGERQIDLSVEESTLGTSTKTSLQPPSPQEGAVGFLKRGEEGIYRQIGLHIERERHPFAVILRFWPARSPVVPGKDAAPGAGRDLPSLIGDLLRQAGSGDLQIRLPALELLGLLRSREAEGVFRAARGEPRLRAAAILGLASLGDRDALGELEKMAGPSASKQPPEPAPDRGRKIRAAGLEALEGGLRPAAVLDGQSPEVSWQNRAMLVLLEAGREAGFDSLARRISEIDSLAIHLALAEAAGRIDRIAPATRDLLLDAVSSPEFLAQLIWDDPEIEYFYGVLLENPEVAKRPQFVQRLLLGLSRTMGTDAWGTSGRPRIFARLWERISRGGGDPEVLQDVLKEVLSRAGSPARLNEIVAWLGLCFHDDPLPEEEFKKILLLIRGALIKEEDLGPSIPMASNALLELTRSLALTEPQLIELARLLTEAAQAPRQPYAAQFLREIERLTGISTTRARTIGPGASTGPEAERDIAAQVARWATSPAETSAAFQRLFPSAPAAGTEESEYWEFDLLIVDPPREGAPAAPSAVPPERRVDVLDGRRLRVRAGVPFKFTDRWGNRLSYRIEAERTMNLNRYRINGQAYLEPGQPSFVSLREKEIKVGRYETSDIRLGTYYLFMPRGQRVTRLAAILPVDPSRGASPGADEPSLLWEEFLKVILEKFSAKNGERLFNVIRELNLREAIPFLQRELQRDELLRSNRFEFAQGLARWLLERGDPAGRDYLLGELEAAEVRRRAQAAQLLAGAGDPTGFQAVLKLLGERPREVNPHAALTSLDLFLRDRPLESEECREVVDLVLANLQDPPFQTAGFALLSRLSENDFGYPQAVRQVGEARKLALSRAVDAARSWWTARRPSPPSEGK